MPHIVFIEGNIASGKSTLLDNLKNLNNSERFGKVQVIKEPLDKWKNLSDSNGTNILKHFYMNMERFAYSFQSFAFLKMTLSIFLAPLPYIGFVHLMRFVAG